MNSLVVYITIVSKPAHYLEFNCFCFAKTKGEVLSLERSVFYLGSRGQGGRVLLWYGGIQKRDKETSQGTQL